MIRKPILALAVAAALNPLTAGAVGVGGDIQLHSALNEALSADISLNSVAEGELESLSVTLASPEAFAKAGLERPYYLTDLRFSTGKKADGQPVIRVTSKNPVREPFLNFLIEVNWPKGKVMREFTLLLDPPTSFKRQPPIITTPDTGAQPTEIQRAPAAVPTSQAPGQDYKIQPNDTLWSIAKRTRPAGVSNEQMMLAIFRNNPQAFPRNNMNFMRAGTMLRIPEKPQVPHAEARGEFLSQVSSWEGTEAQPAEPRPRGTGIDATGPVKPPQDRGDRLEIVTQPGKQAGVPSEGKFEQNAMAQLEKDLMLTRELNEKVSAENNELQGRLKRLEYQLSDLERLLNLKNDKAALLQQQAQQQAGEGTAEPARVTEPEAKSFAEQPAPEVANQGKKPEPPVVEPIEQPVQTAQQVTAETKPATGTQLPAAERETAPPPVKEAQPEQKPAERKPAEAMPAQTKPVAPPVVTPPETGRLDDLLANPLLLAGGGGALLLLLILVALKSRRGGKPEQAAAKEEREALLPDEDSIPRFEDSSILKVPVGYGDEGHEESSLLLDFTPSELQGMGADSEIDPVSEADVYVAYGRFHQARELLREAIDRSPKRADLKLKMLEVLHVSGQHDDFLTTARIYADQGLPQQNAEGWARIAVLGRELDPDSPLFGGAGVAKAPPVAPVEPMETASQLDQALEELSSLRLPEEDEAEAPAAPMVEQPAEVRAEIKEDEDFLSLDDLEHLGVELDSAVAEEVKAPREGTLSAIERDVGIHEEEVLGRDRESAEANEPVIDLASQEDREALAAIEAFTGIRDSELDVEHGVLAMDEDHSLEDLEAQLGELAAQDEELHLRTTDEELDASLRTADQELAATAEPRPAIDFGAVEEEIELPVLELEEEAETLIVAPLAPEAEEELLEIPELTRPEVPESLKAPEARAEQGGDEFELPEDELSELDILAGEGEEDPVLAKLELAEAYIDMSDPDGARSILEEVLQEGSAEQKARAQQMLASLG